MSYTSDFLKELEKLSKKTVSTAKTAKRKADITVGMNSSDDFTRDFFKELHKLEEEEALKKNQEKEKTRFNDPIKTRFNAKDELTTAGQRRKDSKAKNTVGGGGRSFSKDDESKTKRSHSSGSGSFATDEEDEKQEQRNDFLRESIIGLARNGPGLGSIVARNESDKHSGGGGSFGEERKSKVYVDIGGGYKINKKSLKLVNNENTVIGEYDPKTGIIKSTDGRTNYIRIKEDGSLRFYDTGLEELGFDTSKANDSWFQAGAFEDGYEFGDLSKSIVATGRELGKGVVKGVLNLAEDTVDTGAYISGGLTGWGLDLFGEDGGQVRDVISEFIAKDIINEDAIADVIVPDIIGKFTEYESDEAALVGKKATGLAESAGQLVAQAGLSSVGVPWWLTSGVSSFGSETENALKQDATFGEAGFSAGISALGEIATEKIFGAFKFQGKGFDDGLKTFIKANIANKTVRTLANLGIDVVGEGVEEILSGYIGAIGQKLSYATDKEIKELFSSEDAWDSFIGGALLGGVGNVTNIIKSNIKGIDSVTGLTKNEQAVVDKVYKDEVAEAEKDGKKLSGTEKNKLYDRIRNDLQKGYISTDTIEEVLGGDTYKQYRDAIDSENAALKEFEGLYEGDELEQQKKSFQEHSKLDSIREQLGNEVSEKVKGDRLIESYNEKIRRKQLFTADLTKYSEKSQAVVQKAIDSGVLNNTNRSHELVDLVAKIAGDKGIDFDFTNNEKLKESGFAVEGATINGFRSDNGVTVNVQSKKALNSVVGHEITHVLEGTQLYGELQKIAFEYAEMKGEYKDRLRTANETYKNVEGYQGVDGYNKIKSEVLADIVGDYLFTDADFVKNLSANHRNVFQKIYDEIKYLYKVATAGSKEAKELEKLKKVFEESYRESEKNNTANNSGAQHSIERTKSMSWSDQINGALYNGKGIRRNDTLVVGSSADTSVANEIDNKPLAIPQRVLTKASSGKDISHSIKKGKLAKLDEGIKNAPITVVNPDRNALVYVTNIKQGGLPILVSFDMNATFDGDDVHEATSIHLQVDTKTFLEGLPASATVYVQKNELDPVGATNNLRGLAAKIKFIDGNIPNNGQNVKRQYSLTMVDPVQPKSNAWQRSHTTEEVKAQFPGLWDIVADDSDTRNPTQIVGTVKSYRKIYDALQAEGFDGKILDASSGLGIGTKAGIEEYGFDVDDIEPYPDKDYNPKYKDYSTLNEKYDVIISNAVLNVLPQEQRDALVSKMGELLNDGGRIFVNVRGKDVESASSKVAIDESQMEYYISNKGTYQKGFTKAELKAYLEDALGDGFKVETTNKFGAVSAIVTKNGGSSVRFSLSKTVEETKDLIAIHNLSASELTKALALGGMPMPSIAVLKAQQSHESYGDVSLIFPKDTIDPKKDKYNKVYGGDAWTPTYPSMEYKVNQKAQEAIESKIDSLVPYEVQRGLGYISLDYDNMSHEINRHNGELQRAYQNNYAMQYAFLVDNGFDEQLPMREASLDGSGRFDNGIIVDVVDKLGTAEIERLADERINDATISALMDIVNENMRKKYADNKKLLAVLRNKPLYTEQNFGFSQADSIIRAAQKYVENGFEQTVDYAEAKNIIEKSVDKEAFNKWLDNLFDGIVEKEGIRNNADFYTPSGNRRSWEALHWENTLENVIKVMRSQNQTGAGFFGSTSIFGVANKNYGSIGEIKADSDRLQTMPQEEYDALKSTFANRLGEIADAIKNPHERNVYIARDQAVEEIVDAVRTSKNKDSILRNMQKWNKRVTPGIVDDIVSLVNDIANMPTGYFEAKPQRAVSFDEVGVFVIPKNADAKLKQELLNRGYSVAEYDPDVEGDRNRVVNQFEEYKFSLSKNTDIAPTGRKYGNYNIRSKDVAFETAPAQNDIAPVAETVTKEATQENLFTEDLAPAQNELAKLQRQVDLFEERMHEAIIAEDYSEFNRIGAEYEPIRKRYDQLVAEEDAEFNERMSSITDEDAPPEIAPNYVRTADNIPITKKLADDIAREVRSSLALSNKHMADVRNIINEFTTQEMPSRSELFNKLKDRFGTYSETQTDDTLAEAKSVLRSFKISVDDFIKSEIADYGDLVKRNFGKVRFSKEGTSVDSAYEELASQYPHLFPEDIISPTDQLMQIIDVANMETSLVSEQRIDDESILGVADTIINQVSAYRNTQREKAAIKHGRESFESLLKDESAVPPVDLDGILRNKTLADPRTETSGELAPTSEIYDTQHKRGVVEGQQAMWNDPVPEKLTRKVLHERIIDNMKNTFHVNGFELDDVLKNAKNLSTFATVDNTPHRVMEKALGYKAGGVLADMTVNKVAQNETEGIKWLNSFTDRKNGLLAQISKQYNIKPGSKQSAAAQMYAEGFYVGKNNEIIQYGDVELAQDFPNKQVQENIKGLASDPRIRQVYDETLAMINESRTRNAFPEIPRLDNYFLHFRAMDDTFSRLGLPFNPNDIRAKDLPTDLNGVTADLKPGQPYFASAMHREGKRTSFDLLGGLEKYLNSAKNQIYHIDDIQNLRALRNYIADTYGQANGLEGLDALSEEEQQDRIEQVYGSHLSTFAKFLNEEANVLAGKTALIDRGLEGIIGRRGITFLNSINQQVGKNMVGWNISSSLTNFLPVAQTFAKTNKWAFIKALAQTTSNKVSSIFGKNDGFADNSPVMIRRKGAESFYRTPWQKVSDPGYILMSAVDNISTELITRAKYNELTKKGMDSQKAHIETDKWVSRLMGDRSLGQQPQLYNSKMLGLVTKFQLEVRNQLDSMFYDTIQEAKVSNEEIQNKLARNAKTAAKVTSTFVQLAVVQHLFGKAFESVAGYNPAFDIIEVIVKTLGLDDDEEDEDTVLDNIEEGFLALLEDLPYTSTFTGGRIPISSALPINQLVTGKDDYGNDKPRWETALEALPYYFMPGGYGQAKKTAKGLSMFSDEHPTAGSYTDSGGLRFPVEDTLGNRIKAGVFGQWAFPEARDYIDNERKPLNEKQTQEYIDADMPYADYRDYQDGLSKVNASIRGGKLGRQADYINSLDIPVRTKNLLINNLTNRKDPIDLTDYSNYADFEEFDFAQKNPKKYAFFKEIGVSVKDYNSANEETKRVYTWAYENPKKYDFLQDQGVSLTDWKHMTDSAKDAYMWAYENPDKHTFSEAITKDVVEYRRYTSDLYDIKADKDKNGKYISGSRKTKVAEYISGLDIDDGAKYILFKSEYPSDDTYNYEIIDYLNSRDDISYREMETILKELGFKVGKNGVITWD